MSYCNTNPMYTYPSHIQPRRTSYYDPPSYSCSIPMMPQYACPPMPPPHYHNPYIPHYPQHPQYIYPGGLHSADPFSPPEYDKHLFEEPKEQTDTATVESQHCDSIPIHHHDEHHDHDHHHHTQEETCNKQPDIPNDHHHHHHHEEDNYSTCSSHSSMTSTTYSHCSNVNQPVQQDPPVQQDTFILRLPKNRKCNIKTDEGHVISHIQPIHPHEHRHAHRHGHRHVHVNAYGQVLPIHPQL